MREEKKSPRDQYHKKTHGALANVMAGRERAFAKMHIKLLSATCAQCVCNMFKFISTSLFDYLVALFSELSLRQVMKTTATAAAIATECSANKNEQ